MQRFDDKMSFYSSFSPDPNIKLDVEEIDELFTLMLQKMTHTGSKNFEYPMLIFIINVRATSSDMV